MHFLIFQMDDCTENLWALNLIMLLSSLCGIQHIGHVKPLCLPSAVIWPCLAKSLQVNILLSLKHYLLAQQEASFPSYNHYYNIVCVAKEKKSLCWLTVHDMQYILLYYEDASLVVLRGDILLCCYCLSEIQQCNSIASQSLLIVQHLVWENVYKKKHFMEIWRGHI